MAKVQYIGTGRRKSSVARVRLLPGDGKITINQKPVDFELINEYLSKQKRFNRVTDEIRARIIAEAKNRYETLQRLSELDCV